MGQTERLEEGTVGGQRLQEPSDHLASSFSPMECWAIDVSLYTKGGQLPTSSTLVLPQAKKRVCLSSLQLRGKETALFPLPFPCLPTWCHLSNIFIFSLILGLLGNQSFSFFSFSVSKPFRKFVVGPGEGAEKRGEAWDVFSTSRPQLL